MKKKSNIDTLEEIFTNTEKIDDNFVLLKEQFSEFKEEDRVKISFKDCHVAICPNGGLVAICKKKGFLDITKGTKINDYIIVMHQDAKKKYLIPINWKYKDKWVINLEFNDKEQLYAICNDGTIFKIDILNLKAEQKPSSDIFKNENNSGDNDYEINEEDFGNCGLFDKTNSLYENPFCTNEKKGNLDELLKK